MADALGESDLSQMWHQENRVASPRLNSNIHWPKMEGRFVLRKPSRGLPVTARLFLDFYSCLIMLRQVAYPLASYIENDMKALIETYYKEENLRFLPEDIQAKGVTSLANLDNRQPIYVAQLAARPTSREKWLESFWSCPRPPKPDIGDSFTDQTAHYNYNMALLNLIHETPTIST